jgi:hypothetical protein
MKCAESHVKLTHNVTVSMAMTRQNNTSMTVSLRSQFTNLQYKRLQIENFSYPVFHCLTAMQIEGAPKKFNILLIQHYSDSHWNACYNAPSYFINLSITCSVHMPLTQFLL